MRTFPKPGVISMAIFSTKGRRSGLALGGRPHSVSPLGQHIFSSYYSSNESCATYGALYGRTTCTLVSRKPQLMSKHEFTHNTFSSHDTHTQTDRRTYKATWDTVQRTHNNASLVTQWNPNSENAHCARDCTNTFHTMWWEILHGNTKSTPSHSFEIYIFPFKVLGWLVEQGLTFHSTQFRSFRRRCFYRSDDPTNSVKALKEGG